MSRKVSAIVDLPCLDENCNFLTCQMIAHFNPWLFWVLLSPLIWTYIWKRMLLVYLQTLQFIFVYGWGCFFLNCGLGNQEPIWLTRAVLLRYQMFHQTFASYWRAYGARHVVRDRTGHWKIVDTGQRMAKPDRNFSRMRRLVILGAIEDVTGPFRLAHGYQTTPDDHATCCEGKFFPDLFHPVPACSFKGWCDIFDADVPFGQEFLVHFGPRMFLPTWFAF